MLVWGGTGTLLKEEILGIFSCLMRIFDLTKHFCCWHARVPCDVVVFAAQLVEFGSSSACYSRRIIKVGRQESVWWGTQSQLLSAEGIVWGACAEGVG